MKTIGSIECSGRITRYENALETMTQAHSVSSGWSNNLLGCLQRTRT